MDARRRKFRNLRIEVKRLTGEGRCRRPRARAGEKDKWQASGRPSPPTEGAGDGLTAMFKKLKVSAVTPDPDPTVTHEPTNKNTTNTSGVEVSPLCALDGADATVPFRLSRRLQKKFTKTKEEVEEAQQQSAPTATASSGVASTSSTAMAPPPQPDPAAAATALGSSGSKLADRLKKISISSERIARGGPGKGGSRRLLAGPGVEPPPSSAPRPTPPPPAAFEASAWVDFGATPTQPQQPRSPHPPSQPSVVEAGVAERTVEPTMVAEEKYPPPQFLSPIEEARRKWEAAALLNPPSFRSEAEDLSNSGGRGPELSRMASDTSSIAAGLGASASSLDGWSAPQEPPDSPLLLRTPTRTISNTSANLRSQVSPQFQCELFFFLRIC